MIGEEVPRPRITRPGANASTVAALNAYTTGVRICTGMTPLASRMRFVRAAIAVIKLNASGPATSGIHAES
jgi:hypothetical protein